MAKNEVKSSASNGAASKIARTEANAKRRQDRHKKAVAKKQVRGVRVARGTARLERRKANIARGLTAKGEPIQLAA